MHYLKIIPHMHISSLHRKFYVQRKSSKSLGHVAQNKQGDKEWFADGKGGDFCVSQSLSPLPI